MKRKLLSGIAVLVLIITACNNPFFPERQEKEITTGDSKVPVISIENSNLSDAYCVEDEEITLTVGVEGDEDDYSYQWYSNTENSNEGGTPIPGATGSSFNPPTDEVGTTYYYVVITNKKNGKTTKSDTVKVRVYPEGTYIIKLVISGNVNGDTVGIVEPHYGNVGQSVTLNYTVINTARYNLLDFSGVASVIASADSAGNGTRTYTINSADAVGSVITIIAIFTHTNLEPDPIVFTNLLQTKTYGDAAFTNAVTSAHLGTGAITYSSNDTNVAVVNSTTGRVTILKAGSVIINAKKSADAVYASAQANYALTVNRKPVTITGLSASNKIYDGTTTATVTGTAVISGLVSGDTVTVGAGTAEFANASVGNGKTVIFSGYSLTGIDASNYSLSAQPANVTANIVEAIISMVQIPAGTFIMGSPVGEAGRRSEYDNDNEMQHSVTLTKSFKMGKYQVTQEQYQVVMGSNPSSRTSAVSGESGTPGKLPVEQVSWYDAIVFCNKLSVMEGLSPVYSISGSTDPSTWGTVPTSSDATWNAVVMDRNKNGYRLPTEAEWEYACRAGTTTAFNNGNDDYTDATSVGAVGWYGSNASGRTHQVGLKTPNAWGLYDMHGNVFEWCWDWYKADITADTIDPTGAVAGEIRVLRGGCYVELGNYLRSASRPLGVNPSSSFFALGFRLVRF
jgi:formylglycine-generating enzyme required for sulfatase activity